MQRGTMLSFGLLMAVVGAMLMMAFDPTFSRTGVAGPGEYGAWAFWSGLALAALGIRRLFT